MKKYKVIDGEGMQFMDYTHNEPMTANELRSHFWAFDEARTMEYKHFTLAYIQEVWSVEFEVVEMEKILCAAIWYEDLTGITDRISNCLFLPKNLNKGLVFCGYRHHQCIYFKSVLTNKRDSQCGKHTQGFLTSRNRFVDREEAAIIALQSKQIKAKLNNRKLYSEDLY